MAGPSRTRPGVGTVVCGPGRFPLVGEAPPQLGGEAEPVVAGNALRPAARDPSRRGPIEGGVDLDGVEVCGQIAQRVETLRLRPRIDLPGPARVIPARRPGPD